MLDLQYFKECKLLTSKDPAPTLNREKKSIYLNNPKAPKSPKLPIFGMILIECKQILDFPVMNKSTLGKWCFGFVGSIAINWQKLKASYNKFFH